MTQASRILRMLKEAGEAGVPNHELAKVSLQYNARVHTLRHAGGHDIRKRRVYHGTRAMETYMYYLVSPLPSKPAISVLAEEPPKLFEMEVPKPPTRMWG